MRARTTAQVIRTARRAVNALKDLHEDAHSVSETRDAARGYLSNIETVEQIEKFIKALKP